MRFEDGYLLRKNPNLIEAVWCFDSENAGVELLIDLKTSEIIAKRYQGEILDPHKEVPHVNS